jgi:photosystem II stability/assembly factor-like uncharacterized protein
MKQILFIAFTLNLCCVVHVFGQTKRTNLEPLSPVTSTASTPEWAKLMYSDAPNVFEVDRLFNAYYRNNEYKKTTDTRNYKHWRRYLSLHDCVLPDGTIALTTETEKQARLDSWVKLRGEQEKSMGLAERSPSSTWSQIGPYENVGATISAISRTSCQVALAQCPGNMNVLYSASQNGKIFKTTDHGDSWISVGENYAFPGDTYTEQCLAVHPTNADIVYYGSGNQIYKTTDGGTVWTLMTTITGLSPTAIIINPTNPNTLFVASALNLYKSTDGGLNFTISRAGRCWDIRFKTNDPNTLFAICRNGNKSDFYKSTDGGSTWGASISGWFSLAQTTDTGGRMTVSTGNPNLIYCFIIGKVTADPNPSGNIVGIAKSTDAGATWTTPVTYNNAKGISASLGFYALDIEVSDSNDNLVLVGTVSTYKTTNGFSTVTTGPPNLHPDAQEYLFTGPNDFWIANDGGIDLCTSDLSSRVSKSFGITGTEFWGFDQGWNEDVRVGSYYHNGTSGARPSYPDNKWRGLSTGEPATGYVGVGYEARTWFSDVKGVNLPAVLTESYSTFNYAKFPNEAHWTYPDRSEVVTHPLYFDTHFLGRDHVLWKTTDGGATYTALFTFGTDASHKIASIEVCRSNPDVLILSQFKTINPPVLWKSTDGGISFQSLTLPSGFSGGTGLLLASDPTNADIFWIANTNTATTTTKVFKTTNGGNTWTNITGTLSSSTHGGIRAILHIGGTNGGVYAMTRHGMYYRNNTHSDWQLFVNGLPPKIDNNYLRPFYKTSKLRMATIARGLWEVEFYEQPAGPLAQPIVKQSSSLCHRDTFQFDDFSMLNHTNASWQWTFSPAPQYVSSVTARNPKVVFGSGGNYSVTLTVTDGQGNSNTKVVPNMVTLPAISLCDLNTGPKQSGQVSGGTNYFTSTHPLPFGTTNTITISAWVRLTQTTSTIAGVATTTAGGGTTGLQFLAGNKLGYAWGGGFSSWAGGPTLTTNKWAHVALVIKPDSASVFLDGVEYLNVGANLHPMLSFSNPFWVGNSGGTSQTMRGEIDELRLYNRALTKEEIRELRHLSYPSYASTDPGLKAYYKFNEPSGVAFDRIGTSNLVANGVAVTRVVETAPFEKGMSQRLNITGSGTTTYGAVGVAVEFAAGGTYPNGEVYVTRVDSTPIAPYTALPTAGGRYWVINNYGANAMFTSPSAILFSNVPVAANIPERYKLYRRGENEYAESDWVWVDNADAVTVGQAGSILFQSGLSLTGGGQLAIFDFAHELPAVQLTNTFIQGYMNGTQMLPVLQMSGITGAPASQADTISISLHQAIAPYARVHTYRGVLNIDGTVKAFFPPSANNTSWYIAINGRNILETWSSSPVLITPTTIYSFATAFGNNLGISSGIPVIYSGNIDAIQDDNIDLIDYPIWEAAYNIFTTGYHWADLNGDGNVDLIDYPIWEANYSNFITVMRP